MTEVANNFLEEKETSFDIRSFFLNWLRYWYWFVLSILVALGGAYMYLRYTTPVYQIGATLLIKTNPISASDKILTQGAGFQNSKVVDNEIEILKSRGLMLNVVEQLNLTVSYFKQGKVRTDEEVYDKSPVGVNPITLTATAYQEPVFIHILNKQQYELQDGEGTTKGKYGFGQPIKSDYGILRVFLRDSIYQETNNLIKVVFTNPEQVSQHYKSILKVTPLNQESGILRLTLEDAVPAKGKAILNKLLEAYNSSALADKNLEATHVLEFIDERLRLITGELNTVERDVESYKSAQGITDLSNEGSMFLTNVNATDAKLNENELQLKVLDGIDTYMKSSQTGTAPAAPGDPVLSTLLGKLNSLSEQQEKYSRTMQATNPILQAVTDQIQTTKAAIQENIANQRQNLVLNRENAQQLNKRFESGIRNIPRKEREFITIKRQQSIKENLYLLLLQKKEETAIAYAATVTDSRVVDEAFSSSIPLRPNRPNIFMVAFLIGLLIPAGGVSAKILLSGKVQNRSQIENETGIAVFAEIMSKPRQMADNIIAIGSNQLIAEQFKVLRANLPYADGSMTPMGGQLMLVTSSIVGEGKSFFAINMASSLAQLDKRVIILELDLRQPKTTDYMGMPDGQVMGISNYLTGQQAIDDIIRPTTLHSNLWLISSGPIPPNPSELLSNGRIGVLLQQLRQQFDYIILDTPPVAHVADTLILGPYADRAFYMVRHQYTPRNCMNLLTNLAASQKFKSLNVIFNDVAYEKSQEFGYGYGSYR